MWPRALRRRPGPSIPLSPADVPETVQAQQQLDLFHRRFVIAGLLGILAGLNVFVLVALSPDGRWTPALLILGLHLFGWLSRERGRAEMARSLQKVILEASRRQDEGFADVVEAMTRMQEDEDP